MRDPDTVADCLERIAAKIRRLGIHSQPRLVPKDCIADTITVPKDEWTVENILRGYHVTVEIDYYQPANDTQGRSPLPARLHH